MARVYLITNTFKIVYTIDRAVGAGCPNDRADVMLVQFFLKVVSEGPERSLHTPPGRPPITTDGIWGPTSQAYLDLYISVNSSQNPNNPLKKDGRVDPVVNGKVFGSVSNLVYTILALNVSYKNVRGPDSLLDITTDPLFPKELRPSIKISNA